MSQSIRTRQEPLFVESLEEAVEATAMACGGKKAFACLLRPDLDDEPERAHRWLLDALNNDRRTELHASHLARACKVGAEHGCHILKHWFDDFTGYQRTAVAPTKTPQQELAEQLARKAQEFQRLADQLAQLQDASPKLRSAS